MELSEKIKALRLNLGMKQADFGASMPEPVNQSTVQRWEAGKHEPSAANMTYIAKLAGQSAEQFMAKTEGESPYAGVRMVNVTGLLQAGAWTEAPEWAEDEQHKVPVSLPKMWSKVPVHAREVRGESMNLVIPNGSTVFLARLRDLGRSLRNGDIVAVQRIGADGLYESTLKEYVIDSNRKITLMPRSNRKQFQEPVPYRQSSKGVHIVGVVIAVQTILARP